MNYIVRKYRPNHRHSPWAVEREDGTLVCLTTYKIGALTVREELTSSRWRAALAQPVANNVDVETAGELTRLRVENGQLRAALNGLLRDMKSRPNS